MRTPSPRRPAPNIVFSALIVLLAVGPLSGCMATAAPSIPAPTAVAVPPAPTEDPPVFASNDEALAAATTAFANYLAAGDSAGAVGSESWNSYMALTVGAAHDAPVW